VNVLATSNLAQMALPFFSDSYLYNVVPSSASQSIPNTLPLTNPTTGAALRASFNSYPTTATPAPALQFPLTIVESTSASLQQVVFNAIANIGTVAGSATGTTLTTAPDTSSLFNAPGATPSASPASIQFNQVLVPGATSGYYASVPWATTSVVADVSFTSNFATVQNNGYPAITNVGSQLPNSQSGYVTPVFFLNPGANVFTVTTPSATSQGAAYGNAFTAGTIPVNPNGDGSQYTFVINRDPVLSLVITASQVAANGATFNGNVPATTSTQYLNYASGSSQTSWVVNVGPEVQAVSAVATFYGALKATSTWNVNNAQGQQVVGSAIAVANGQPIQFALSPGGNGAPSTPTTITFTGGILPIQVTFVRAAPSIQVLGFPAPPASPFTGCTGTYALTIFPNANPANGTLYFTASNSTNPTPGGSFTAQPTIVAPIGTLASGSSGSLSYNAWWPSNKAYYPYTLTITANYGGYAGTGATPSEFPPFTKTFNAPPPPGVNGC
jgi:hypothetical protein